MGPRADLSPVTLPAGFGLHRTPLPLVRGAYPTNLEDLYGFVLVWEPPRRRPFHREFRYVVSADVADGLGQDRSVVDVTRVATVTEPEEQVAQFVSPFISPASLAHVVDAVGNAYTDDTGYQAKAAIELNNHGLSTQDMLQLHLGYHHFYIWEKVDRRDPKQRFTQTIGWMTTPTTRPILIDRYVSAILTVDPVHGIPDYVINSPFTLEELRDFHTEGELGEAEGAKFDDCIMAGAIGHYVAWRWQGGEQLPVSEMRRQRIQAEDDRQKSHGFQKRDYRNTDCTLAEMRAGVVDDPELEMLVEGRERYHW